MNEQKTNQKWTITLFTIGVFMAGLDNGIISAALTTIYNSFNVSPSWGTWSVTLYTLGIAISVPIIGKLSDNYGRKRLFLIEIFLFGLGSLFVALSPNFIALLIARFIQAIGGGGIFIIATSHVLATIPKGKQGRILGLLGGMHGISAIVGPNIGALILRLTGTWEWMFLINIPIVIFVFFMAFNKMDETRMPSEKPLDLVGAVYLSGAVLLFMFAITNIDGLHFTNSFFSVHVLPYFIAGILAFLFFLRHEKRLEARGGDPIISYRLLSRRGFQFTLLLGFLSGGFLASIIFIPSYVQQVLHVPAENAGFWLTPLAFASALGAGFGGFLTDKIGSIRTIFTAGIVGLAGFLLFIFSAQTFTTFFIASFLAGIGLGFLLGAPLNVLAGHSAEKVEYGTAIGSLSLFRQVGLALFPTVFAGFISTGVMRIEPIVTAKFGEGVLSFAGVKDGEGYGIIMEEVGNVVDPALQEQLYSLISGIMKNGFQHMFFSAVVVSVIVLLISSYLLLSRSHTGVKGRTTEGADR